MPHTEIRHHGHSHAFSTMEYTAKNLFTENESFLKYHVINASSFDILLNSTESLNNITSPFGNATWPPNRARPPNLGGQVRIPLYCIIFLLAVIGNALVIVTLAQNRRMRTVTNVFLINLSISDLLLAVFCMPFTLIPTLLRNFIFGKAMCILLRYLQGKFHFIYYIHKEAYISYSVHAYIYFAN